MKPPRLSFRSERSRRGGVYPRPLDDEIPTTGCTRSGSLLWVVTSLLSDVLACGVSIRSTQFNKPGSRHPEERERSECDEGSRCTNQEILRASRSG